MDKDKRNSIRILHITDIHFGVTHPELDYHNTLFNYAIKNFKYQIDYLVVTGDLGNQCSKQSEVSEWLSKLIKGLEIDQSKVILCAGNHDMERGKLPLKHQEKRLLYEEGLNYIFGNLENKESEVFASYEKIHFELTNRKEKFIWELDDVRFIVLNSSLLSQENKKFSDLEKMKSLSYTLTKREEEILAQFGFMCRLIPGSSIDENKSNESLYSCTLRYSENLRQQLRIKDEFIKELDNITDDKLNIVVFHHPESHLHTFERFPAHGISGSGSYKSVTEKGHVLICGHIHPATHMKVDTSGVISQIPEFIGGPAHYASKKIKPSVYCYSFTKTDQWNCNKEPYLLNEENEIIKREDIPVRIPAILRNYSAYAEVKKSILIDEKPIGISSESEYTEIKKSFFKFIGITFEKILKDATLNVINRDFEKVWINLVDTDRQKQIVLHTFQVQDKKNQNYQIILDLMFSDEFVERDFITGRVIWGGKKTSIDSRRFYIPICLDILCNFMPPNEIGKNAYRIHNLIKLSLENPVFDDDGTKFYNLANALILPTGLKNSNFTPPLARGNIFFTGSGLVNYIRENADDFKNIPILQLANQDTPSPITILTI